MVNTSVNRVRCADHARPRRAGVRRDNPAGSPRGRSRAAVGPFPRQVPGGNPLRRWRWRAPRRLSLLLIAVAVALTPALAPWGRRIARPRAGIVGGVLVSVVLRVGIVGLLVVTGLVG